MPSIQFFQKNVRSLMNFLINQKRKMVHFITLFLIVCVLVLSAIVILKFIDYRKENPGKILISYNMEKINIELLPNDLNLYTYYRRQFVKRNVFQIPNSFLPPDESMLVNQDYDTQNSNSLQLLLKNLNLVGILVDQKPIAVIEDLQTKETLFLSVGDQIGEIRVKEIKKNGVVMQYKGQNFELN